MVYRFITTGTLEERINQILLDKRELAEITIECNEKFITEMSNEDLKEMLKLREKFRDVHYFGCLMYCSNILFEPVALHGFRTRLSHRFQ